MIYRYIPRAKRREVSRRLLAAKQAKRECAGVDADTMRWRALHPIPKASPDFNA